MLLLLIVALAFVMVGPVMVVGGLWVVGKVVEAIFGEDN